MAQGLTKRVSTIQIAMRPGANREGARLMATINDFSPSMETKALVAAAFPGIDIDVVDVSVLIKRPNKTPEQVEAVKVLERLAIEVFVE